MQRANRRIGLVTCSFLALGATGLSSAQIGSVGAQQKISATSGGFGGTLVAGYYFGTALAFLGDLDGDGAGDLAVGTPFDNDGGTARGAVWILFLNADGTVRAQQKISQTSGGFGGTLSSFGWFGGALAALGDLDGDGVGDLAVGNFLDDDGASGNGAVWVLFLNTNGTVKAQQKISQTSGGFGGVLASGGYFGYSLGTLGDLDGDGVVDLAVGAVLDGSNGALWIVFLNANGTVKAQQKITSSQGGFGGVLTGLCEFGSALAGLGDLDADGVEDLAVGSDADDTGGVNNGAVWILFLNADGTVKTWQKICSGTGGFGGTLHSGDLFGVSLSALGDFDHDGVADLAVGAFSDNDGGTNQGACWILFLRTNGRVRAQQKISETAGGFGGVLDPDDGFGRSVSALGDLDGDGAIDLAVGASLDDDGDFNEGAVWVLFLEGDTTPPTITCPSVVREGGTPGATVGFTVSATDDTDPAPVVVCVPPSGSYFPRGTTLVTCTATDNWGNQSMCSFPVIVWPTVRR